MNLGDAGVPSSFGTYEKCDVSTSSSFGLCIRLGDMSFGLWIRLGDVSFGLCIRLGDVMMSSF